MRGGTRYTPRLSLKIQPEPDRRRNRSRSCDADGVVNGIIVDPSGPVISSTSSGGGGGAGGGGGSSGGGGCFIATAAYESDLDSYVMFFIILGMMIVGFRKIRKDI